MKILTFVFQVFIVQALFGQVPLVGSHSLTIGKVGQIDSIFGSGFSPISQENQVLYGTKPAEILFASTQLLVTKVPKGIGNIRVQVITQGKRSPNTLPFAFIFETNYAPLSSYFALSRAINFSTNFYKDSYIKLLEANIDFDRDGLTDFVLSNEGISIARNQGLNYYESNDFWLKRADFVIKGYDLKPDFIDLNNDFKPEIIVYDNDKKGVLVYWNKSTPGSILFESNYVTLTDIPQLKSYQIMDINRDGYLDFVATTNFKILAILQEQGNEDIKKFKLPVSLYDDVQPILVKPSDLDNNGFDDLVYFSNPLNQGMPYSMCVLVGPFFDSIGQLNATLPNKLTLISSLNWLPNYYTIDLNLDGKPEVCLHDYSLGMKIYRNTSTGQGNYAFAAPVTTPLSDGLFHDLNGDGRPEYLNNSNGTIFKNSSTGLVITNNIFDTSLASSSGYNVQNQVVDLNNDAVPDLCTMLSSPGSIGYSINRLTEFIIENTPSLPIQPNERIGIIISNRRVISNNNQYILELSDSLGNFNNPFIIGAKVSNKVKDTIIGVIPHNLPSGVNYRIRIFSTGNQTYCQNTLNDLKVVQRIRVDSVNPVVANTGEIITIYGNNFPTEVKNIQVQFGAVVATVIANSTNQIKVIVPKGASQDKIKVYAHGYLAYSPTTFRYKYSFNQQQINANNYIRSYWSIGGTAQNIEFALSKNTKFPSTIIGPSTFFTSGVNDLDSNFAMTFFDFTYSVSQLESPQLLGVADLDKDGIEDFVLYSLVSNGIGIASIKLKEISSFTTGNKLKDVALGDMNLDGKPEVVALLANPNRIQVYQNSSIGMYDSIAYALSTTKTLPVNIQCHKIKTVDLDRDGRLDVIILDSLNSQIVVYKNNDSANGYYSLVGPTVINIAFRPNYLEVEDINNDNKLDLVIANTTNRVFYYLNNCINGINSASFADSGSFNLASIASYMKVIDINNDGRFDIYTNNTVLMNNYASGVFNGSSFSPLSSNPLPNAYCIKSCDLNADGKADLVGLVKSAGLGPHPNYSLEFRYANYFSKLEIKYLPKQMVLGEPLQLVYSSGNANVTNTITSTISFYEVGGGTLPIHQINHSSNKGTDTVTVNAISLQDDRKYYVVVNNLYGISTADTIYVERQIKLTGPKSIYASAGETILLEGENLHLVDFIRVGDQNTEILSKTPTQLQIIVPVGMSIKPISLVQKDKQTRLTNHVIHYTHYRDTAINTGSFEERFEMSHSCSKLTYQLVDFNNDGVLEAIFIPINPTSFYKYIEVHDLYGTPIYKLNERANFFVCEDVNNDGRVDIILSNDVTKQILVYLNISSSSKISFDLAAAIETSFPVDKLLMIDLDENGKLDIMAVNELTYTSTNYSNVCQYINVSQNGFIDNSSFIKTGEIRLAEVIRYSQLVDLNNDNRKEFVVCTASDMQNLNNNVIRIYSLSYGKIPKADCGLNLLISYSGTTRCYGIAAADLDNDNYPELIACRLDKLLIYANKYTTGIITSTTFGTPFIKDDANYSSFGLPDPKIIVADFDADGRVDISSGSGNVFKNIYQTGKQLSQASFWKSPFFNLPLNLDACDVNQDGKVDFFGSIVYLQKKNEIKINTPTPNQAYPDFYTEGDSVVISFTTTIGYFKQGNKFRLELSDTNGLFNESSRIIVEKNSINPDTFVWVIPKNLIASSRYRFKVSATYPRMESVNTVNFVLKTKPQIYSFEPRSGVIGSLVTIKGNNFSPDLIKNIVYLGDLRCQVVEAFGDEITIRIPQSARFNKFKVWVDSVYTSSRDWFIPVFNANGTVTSNFQLKKLPKVANGYFDEVTLNDIDGDGIDEYINQKNIYHFGINNVNDSLYFKSIVDHKGYFTGRTRSNEYAGRIFMNDANGDGVLDVFVAGGGCKPFMDLSMYSEKPLTTGLSLFQLVNSNNIGQMCAVFSNNNGLVEDFNADGLLDYAVESGYGFELVTGGLKFKSTNLRTMYDKQNKVVISHGYQGGGTSMFLPFMYSYDMNGDSLDDIVKRTAIFINKSKKGKTGEFAFEKLINSGYLTQNITFSPLYADEDYKMDEVRLIGDSVIIFRNISNGIAYQSTPIASFYIPNVKKVMVADVNGDKKLDVAALYYSDSSRIGVIESNQSIVNTNYSFRMLGKVPSAMISPNGGALFQVQDFDFDGRPDIIISGEPNDSTLYYFKNKIPTFALNILKRKYCLGDSLELELHIQDKNFQSNSTFNIQLSNHLGLFTTYINLGNVPAQGKFKIAIPNGIFESSRYKLRVVATNPSDTGFVAKDSISIFNAVLPAFIAQRNGSQALCENDTIKLVVNNKGSTSLKWFINKQFAGVTDTFINITRKGTYNVIADNNGCRKYSKDTIINFLPRPKIDIEFNSDAKRCVGQILKIDHLIKENVKEYKWYFNDTIPILNNNNFLNVSQGGKYSTELVDSNGCKSSRLDTFLLFYPRPIPSFSITGKARSCQEDSVILAVTNIKSSSSYKWYLNRTLLVANDKMNIVVKTAGNYSLEVKDSNGCVTQSADTAILKFPVNNLRVLSNKTFTICDGDSIKVVPYSVSPIKSIIWRRNFNPLLNDTLQVLTIKQSGRYGFQMIDSNDCNGLSNDTLVSVKPSPNATLMIIKPNNLCVNDSVRLSVPQVVFQNYQWYSNGLPILGATKNSFAVYDSSKIRVKVSDFDGCARFSNDTQFLFKSGPRTNILAISTNSFCEGDSIAFKSSNVAPELKYQWYLNNVKQLRDTFSQVVVKLGGTVSLTIMDSTGCNSAKIDTNVIRLNKPSIDISPKTAQMLCPGDSLLLTVASSPLNSFIWFQNGLAIPNSGSNYWVKNTANYSIKVKDSNNCEDLKVFPSITWKQTPIAILTASPKASFCEFDSIRLQITSPANSTYQWFRNDTIMLSSLKQIVVKDSANYHAVVTSNDQCRAKTNVIKAAKIPLPNATISIAGQNPFCEMDSVKLVVEQNSQYTYKWYKNDTLLVGQNSNNIMVKQQGSFRTIVTNSPCFSSSQVVSVTVLKRPKSPVISRSNDTLYSSANVGNKWLLDGVRLNINEPYIVPSVNGNYRAIVDSTNGCLSDTSNTYNWTHVGLGKIDLLNQTLIYPNPSKGLFTILAAVDCELMVYDVLGKVNYSGLLQANQANQINLNQATPGLYIIKITTKGNILFRQLIIN